MLVTGVGVGVYASGIRAKGLGELPRPLGGKLHSAAAQGKQKENKGLIRSRKTWFVGCRWPFKWSGGISMDMYKTGN